MTLFLVLFLLVIVLLSGIPLFAGLAITSLGLYMLETGGVSGMAQVVYSKLDNYLLVAIPLFALMAQFMIKAKVVDDLYAAAHTAVRHWPGGLGVATIASCTLFAAISGSSVATALTIGSSAIPQMKRYGYPSEMAYGAVAAGGTLGILIPPSGPMVLYAVVANASIGALFVAGLIPGLLLAGAFAVYCMIRAARSPRTETLPRAGLAEMGRAMAKAAWSLALPPLVLGGMYFGVFTATEAAGVGALAAFLIAAIVYRDLPPRRIYEAARDAVLTTATLFLILAAAALFGHVVTLMRLPAELVEAITALGVTDWQFLVAVMVVIFILGMFLETISIILITTPIVLPVLIVLDVDLVWYGILLMVNLELALITPPVGMNLFVIKGITDASMRPIIRGVLPYVAIMICGLAVLMVFPEIALWLPSSMAYGR
ncbi:MAG: TRAP transporter large permease [Azospirillaceae bacterium]